MGDFFMADLRGFSDTSSRSSLSSLRDSLPESDSESMSFPNLSMLGNEDVSTLILCTDILHLFSVFRTGGSLKVELGFRSGEGVEGRRDGGFCCRRGCGFFGIFLKNVVWGFEQPWKYDSSFSCPAQSLPSPPTCCAKLGTRTDKIRIEGQFYCDTKYLNSTNSLLDTYVCPKVHHVPLSAKPPQKYTKLFK
jgi:hypothetical protein